MRDLFACLVAVTRGLTVFAGNGILTERITEGIVTYFFRVQEIFIMKCARCSAEIPAQSQFCLRCGTPIHATGLPAHAAPAAAVFPAPRQTNKPLIAAVTVLLLAILGVAAFFVNSALTQKAANRSNGQLVQAPGEGGAGALVQAPGNSHPSAPVQAPADSDPNRIVQAPKLTINTADIDDYLRFVKRCEDQKMVLIKQELAAALASSAGQLAKQAEAATDDQKSKDYLPGVAKESTGFEADWNNLTKVFTGRTPPQSCIQLHDAYYAHLGKIQGQFAAYHSALATAQSDPNKALQALTAMQGTASVEADKSARSADDELYDICKKYNLRKEYDIKTDPSGSTGSLR